MQRSILTRITTFSIFLLMALALTGCGSAGMKLNLEADTDLNPNHSNESMPVVVRVYQLADDKVFLNTSFNDIWKDDSKILGRDLLSRDEFVMSPGSEKKQTYDREDGIKYVAVIGIYRKPEGKEWRDITEVTNGFFTKKLAITLENNSIIIED